MKLFLNGGRLFALGLLFFLREQFCSAAMSTYTFGNSTTSYVVEAISVPQSGTNVFIAVTSFDKKDKTSGKYWLWEINQEGKRVQESLISMRPEHRAFCGFGGYIDALTILGGETAFMVGSLELGGRSLVRVKTDGEVVFAERISKSRLSPEISGLVLTSETNLLAIGFTSRDGFVRKIDLQGSNLWERTYDLGQGESFTDIVAMGKGGFMVVGCSESHTGMLDIGPSAVWMVKCDEEGNIISEDVFPGRRPRICQLNSGNYVISYDKSSSLKGEYRIRSYAANMALLWDKQVVTAEESAEPMRISAIPGGGFVVAGCVEFSLNYYQYDKKGILLNSVSFDPNNFELCNARIAVFKEKVFIVLTSANETNEEVNEVKVVAIDLLPGNAHK